MTWDVFYARFYGWAESTRISRISSLENFGDADEVYEVATGFDDEKAATRFLKKAVEAGVRFTPTQVADMVSYVTDDFAPTLVQSTCGKFSEDELEMISGYIDLGDVIKLAKSDLSSENIHRLNSTNRRCKHCGTYATSNYCPNCGHPMKNGDQAAKTVKAKPQAFSDEWNQNIKNWLLVIGLWLFAILLFIMLYS